MICTVKEYTATSHLGGTWTQAFRDVLIHDEVVFIPLAVCLRCGFLFYKRVFDDQELGLLYKEEHRYDKAEISATKPGRIWELDMMTHFIARNVSGKTIETVMDVGAGDFVALQRVVSLLPEASVSAIDPSYDEPSFEKIRVFQTMLKDFQQAEKYDFVMAVHVLEHVGDLQDFLSQLTRITKRYLYIEVPFQVTPGLFLNRSVNAQHINYFTPQAVKNLVSLHGFSVVDFEFSTDGYLYNGMPGMMRLFAVRDEETKKSKVSTGLLETLYYLLSPIIFLRAKLKL